MASKLSLKDKIKMAATGGLITLVTMTSMTACVSQQDTTISTLNFRALNALNKSAYSEEVDNGHFSKFMFTAAEFETADEEIMDVDVHGIAKYKKDGAEKKAYTTLTYSVEKAELTDISKKHDALNKLSEIIKQKDPTAITLTELSKVKSFNKTAETFVENTGGDGYDFKDALIFAVTDIKIDEESNKVSFVTKSCVEFDKETMITTTEYYGGLQNKVTRKETIKSESIQTHKIILDVSAQDISSMKENNSLILDKFVELVENKEQEKFEVAKIMVEANSKNAIVNNLSEEELEMIK